MKKSYNKSVLSLFITLFGLGIIAVLFTAISIYANKIAIIYGVKFISFQFFGMLLPGMALVVILKYKSLSSKPHHTISSFVISLLLIAVVKS